MRSRTPRRTTCAATVALAALGAALLLPAGAAQAQTVVLSVEKADKPDKPGKGLGRDKEKAPRVPAPATASRTTTTTTTTTTLRRPCRPG
jgi:hypothetical protein